MSENKANEKARFFKVAVSTEAGKFLQTYWDELDEKERDAQKYATDLLGEDCKVLAHRNAMTGFKPVGFSKPGTGLKKHTKWDGYVPDKRTRTGRAIVEHLLWFECAHQSQWLCKLGFDFMYFFEGNRFYVPVFSRAIEGYIYIRRPKGLPRQGTESAEVFDEDLIEIKEWEMLKAFDTPDKTTPDTIEIPAGELCHNHIGMEYWDGSEWARIVEISTILGRVTLWPWKSDFSPIDVVLLRNPDSES